LEPSELEALVKGVQLAYSALGDGQEQRSAVEASSLVFRRSLYIVEDIAAGEVFTERNVRVIRPGYGLPPKYLADIIGRHAAADIRRGTALKMDLVKGP
jgi:N-acetylneuraminate synthase